MRLKVTIITLVLVALILGYARYRADSYDDEVGRAAAAPAHSAGSSDAVPDYSTLPADAPQLEVEAPAMLSEAAGETAEAPAPAMSGSQEQAGQVSQIPGDDNAESLQPGQVAQGAGASPPGMDYAAPQGGEQGMNVVLPEPGVEGMDIQVPGDDAPVTDFNIPESSQPGMEYTLPTEGEVGMELILPDQEGPDIDPDETGSDGP